jgi:hypothetical protein
MLWTSLAFLLTFGAALFWGGVRRLFGAGADAKPLDAIVWGSVGLVLGGAMLGVAAFVLVKALPAHGSASHRNS